MEVIWITDKVVDARGVITAINWKARAYSGVWDASVEGTTELPPPDQKYVAYDMARRAIDPEGGMDFPGYMRSEWVERRELQPWLFAQIDQAQTEAQVLALLAAKIVGGVAVALTG